MCTPYLSFKCFQNLFCRWCSIHGQFLSNTKLRLISDPELAFMAVAYVERIGLQHDVYYVDKDLSIASASIMENLRALVGNSFVCCDSSMTANSLVLVSRESSQCRRQGITRCVLEGYG
jgi:hypothetical protein